MFLHQLANSKPLLRKNQNIFSAPKPLRGQQQLFHVQTVKPCLWICPTWQIRNSSLLKVALKQDISEQGAQEQVKSTSNMTKWFPHTSIGPARLPKGEWRKERTECCKTTKIKKKKAMNIKKKSISTQRYHSPLHVHKDHPNFQLTPYWTFYCLYWRKIMMCGVQETA